MRLNLTAAIGLICLGAMGQEPVITHIDVGSITWTNAATSGYYQVQWAASPSDSAEYQASWTNLVNVPGGSGLYFTVQAPAVWRVLHSETGFAAEADVEIPEDEATYPIHIQGISQVANIELGLFYAFDWLSGTNWARSWHSLGNISATGAQMAAHVPMIYRLRVMGSNLVIQPGEMQAYIFAGSRDLGRPGRELEIALDGFYLDKTEVTIDRWNQVVEWALTNWTACDLPLRYGPTNYPVARVSWYDAAKWCNARSAMEGFTPVYYADTDLSAVYTNGIVDLTTNHWLRAGTNLGHRLPTEAEWEAAARGTNAAAHFPWGGASASDITGFDANFRTSLDLSEMMFDERTPVRGHFYVPPGLAEAETWDATVWLSAYGLWMMQYIIKPYPASPPGLYDMAGNVSEWCWDRYDWQVGTNAAVNPLGPAAGTRRVHRGGSYGTRGERCTVYERFFERPDQTRANVGFRCARSR